MCSQFMFFPSYIYIVVSNWLMESLDQLFFVSLWNVHIVQLHTESRAVHNNNLKHTISVVQVNKMLATVS